MRIPEEIQASIRAILNYNWPDEAADYEEQFPEDREGHVFEHMKRVSDWLDDVAVGRTDN